MILILCLSKKAKGSKGVKKSISFFVRFFRKYMCLRHSQPLPQVTYRARPIITTVPYLYASRSMSFGSTPIANSMYRPYRGGKSASRLHDMYYVVGHSPPGMHQHTYIERLSPACFA